MGSCLHEVGQLTAAVGHHESVLSLNNGGIHRTVAAIAGCDPQTIALSLLSLDLFITGYPDQALPRIAEAVFWPRADLRHALL
jgi:hypothetical protein